MLAIHAERRSMGYNLHTFEPENEVARGFGHVPVKQRVELHGVRNKLQTRDSLSVSASRAEMRVRLFLGSQNWKLLNGKEWGWRRAKFKLKHPEDGLAGSGGCPKTIRLYRLRPPGFARSSELLCPPTTKGFLADSGRRSG